MFLRPCSPWEAKHERISCNVDSVSEQVSRSDHNVAHMHANAVVDAAAWFCAGIDLGQRSLRLHGTFHSVHRTSKLSKDAISRRVRYAAPILPNEPIEYRPTLGQPPERAYLIDAHETAVALHIRCEDCN